MRGGLEFGGGQIHLRRGVTVASSWGAVIGKRGAFFEPQRAELAWGWLSSSPNKEISRGQSSRKEVSSQDVCDGPALGLEAGGSLQP